MDGRQSPHTIASIIIIMHAPLDGSLCEVLTPARSASFGGMTASGKDWVLVGDIGKGFIRCARDRKPEIFSFPRLFVRAMSCVRVVAQKGDAQIDVQIYGA